LVIGIQNGFFSLYILARFATVASSRSIIFNVAADAMAILPEDLFSLRDISEIYHLHPLPLQQHHPLDHKLGLLLV